MTPKLISATRIVLPLSLVLAIGSPFLSGLLGYERAMGDMRKELVEVQLEAEKRYAKRDSLKAVSDKLDETNQRLSEISGYLRAMEKRGR